jgi:hypothetical protein
MLQRSYFQFLAGMTVLACRADGAFAEASHGALPANP